MFLQSIDFQQDDELPEIVKVNQNRIIVLFRSYGDAVGTFRAPIESLWWGHRTPLGGTTMSLEHLDSVRIIRNKEMPSVIGMSPRQWKRLKRLGDCPPEIRLSERVLGYRLSDVKTWLDKKQGA
jgi:predicted DNA-binding transcriptional regulator AlpA